MQKKSPLKERITAKTLGSIYNDRNPLKTSGKYENMEGWKRRFFSLRFFRAAKQQVETWQKEKNETSGKAR